MGKHHCYTVEQFSTRYKIEGDDLTRIMPLVTSGSGRITTASIKRAIISFPPDPAVERSWVYFIHAPKLKLVKIGHSVDPEGRLRALRCGIPVDMKIVGKVYGGLITERTYHDKFKKLRVSGEWFKATPFLLGMVSHFDQPYDPNESA